MRASREGKACIAAALAAVFVALTLAHHAWLRFHEARMHAAWLDKIALTVADQLNGNPEIPRTHLVLQRLAAGGDFEGFVVAPGPPGGSGVGPDNVRASAREAEDGQDWSVVAERVARAWPAFETVRVPLHRDPAAPTKVTGSLFLAAPAFPPPSWIPSVGIALAADLVLGIALFIMIGTVRLAEAALPAVPAASADRGLPAPLQPEPPAEESLAEEVEPAADVEPELIEAEEPPPPEAEPAAEEVEPAVEAELAADVEPEPIGAEEPPLAVMEPEPIEAEEPPPAVTEPELIPAVPPAAEVAPEPIPAKPPASPPHLVERRRHRRFAGRWPVRCEVQRGDHWTVGETELDATNMCVGGLRLRLPEALPVDTRLRLIIGLPDGPLQGEARVVWRRDADNEAGIEFCGLSDENCARLFAVLDALEGG